MIVKIHQRDHPYVVIDRRALADARLSWRARGLLVYCLTLPADSVVRVRDLIEASPDGSQSVQTGLHELAEFHYAELRTMRNARGHVIGKQWDIYESPELREI